MGRSMYIKNRRWRRMGKFYQDIPIPPLHEANYTFDDEPLELAIIDSFKYIYIYICIVASCWKRDEEHRCTIEELVEKKKEIENHQRKINIWYNVKENKKKRSEEYKIYLKIEKKRMTLKELKLISI